MIDTAQIADVLERAADNAFVRGVAQRRSVRPDGARCASAHLTLAIRQVLGIAEDAELMDYISAKPLSDLYRATVTALGFETFSFLVHWNDDSKTTPNDVIECFRQTAKDLRNV